MLKFLSSGLGASASLIICLISLQFAAEGQSLYSNATAGHYTLTDLCDIQALNSSEVRCSVPWELNNYQSSGADASAAIANYGLLKIAATATCTSSAQPPECSTYATATAQFQDELTFENLPAGSYLNFVISAGTFTPQGASTAFVTETGYAQDLNGGGTASCNFSESGACSAIVAVNSASDVVNLVVTLYGQAAVASPGLSSFIAGIGNAPYLTGGTVAALFMQDSNGNRIHGAKIISTSGYEYPSAYATKTVLTSQPNPSQPGQTVVFTATPTPRWPVPPGAVPTGTVKFVDGTTILGTVRLRTGVATLSTSALTSGTHQITAEYKGDSSFAGSISPTLDQIVN